MDAAKFFLRHPFFVDGELFSMKCPGILVCMVLMTSCFVFAQANQNQFLVNDPNNISRLTHGGVYYTTNHVGDGNATGTPYLIDWTKADLVTFGKDTFRNYEVSYDASKDLFEVKSLSQVKLLDPEKIFSIIFLDRIFISFGHAFYEQLSSGTYIFLKKHKAIIDKANFNPALNTGSRIDQWVFKYDYWVLVRGVLKSFKLNKKSVLKALELSASSLEDAQKGWLQSGKESDYKLFFDSMNSANRVVR
jgi:hypothetical protein